MLAHGRAEGVFGQHLHKLREIIFPAISDRRARALRNTLATTNTKVGIDTQRTTLNRDCVSRARLAAKPARCAPLHVDDWLHFFVLVRLSCARSASHPQILYRAPKSSHCMWLEMRHHDLAMHRDDVARDCYRVEVFLVDSNVTKVVAD